MNVNDLFSIKGKTVVTGGRNVMLDEIRKEADSK